MIRLGLTGSIAAGKSAVSAYLKGRYGAYVVDADAVSREVVLPGSRGLRAVEAAFGRGVLRPDGSLDRKALGKIVFAGAEKRELLNAILHPLIFSRIEELMEACGDSVAVLDAPLLIESGLYRACDRVWLISAPEEARIARMAHRDGLGREEALLRIRAQMPDGQKRAYADAVLENDGDLAALYQKVDTLWQELREDAPARCSLGPRSY